MKATIHTVFSLLALGANLCQAASITLFNTGVDAAAKQLPLGMPDPHWTIVAGEDISTPVPAVVLNEQRPYGHYAVSRVSRWIGHAEDGTGPATYTARLTFDLTGLDPATAVITGLWGADDGGFIRLNGQDSGIGTGTLSLPGGDPANFDRLHSFALDRGFLPTTNTLDIIVNDPDGAWGQGDVTGLNVASLSGTAEPYKLAIRLTQVALNQVPQVELCWQTVADVSYQLQYCDSLSTDQWLPVSDAWIGGDGGEYCLPEAVEVAVAERYYRLQLQSK